MAFSKSAVAFLFLFLLMGAELAHAGFGVTPPYVRNTSLTRNSIYEQQILLVRGDPNVPLKATVFIDAPEIADWIEVIEGDTFPLPRGEQKVPMTVKITVPKNADFKNYKGAIRVKTGPSDDEVSSGAVNISLGAQIDVDIDVIDRVIEDFRVRKISISDLNEGHKFGWLFFPGKIRFGMLIENTGNVDIAPSEVSFRIYDVTGSALLEETKHLGKIEKVIPYETKEVVANLPTRLPAGNYIARYEIKNGDDVKHEGEVNLNVLPYGTLQTGGFGFMGLSLAHKISVLLPILATLAVIIYSIHTIRERRKTRRKRT